MGIFLHCCWLLCFHYDWHLTILRITLYWKWSPCFDTKDGLYRMIWFALYISLFQAESDISLHHFGTEIMHLEIYNAQQRTFVRSWKLRRRLYLLHNQFGLLHKYYKLWFSYLNMMLLIIKSTRDLKLAIISLQYHVLLGTHIMRLINPMLPCTNYDVQIKMPLVSQR